MRMIAMLRVSTAAFVLGALALSGAHAAEPKATSKPKPIISEPDPITIDPANLDRGLVKKDVDQIESHIKYWLTRLATDEAAGDVYKAREGILADYNKYAKSIRYKVTFARSTATAVQERMKTLGKDAPLLPLKEINLAIVISQMTQLTTIDAIDAMVGHRNPGVRFLAWRGYREIRDQAVRTSRKDAIKLSEALKKHAATETSPLVAAVIVDILHLKKPTSSSDAFNKTFDKVFDGYFNTLVGMLKTCCDRLADGDAAWARPCIAALPILRTASDVYKPDRKKATLIMQQMINIAQAAAQAFASAQGVGAGAFQCAPLLQQVESDIGALAPKSGDDIRKPLNDGKMSALEKSKAIRRGVLEWIDRLEESGVKRPVFTPIKKPAPTTQPTSKPAD